MWIGALERTAACNKRAFWLRRRLVKSTLQNMLFQVERRRIHVASQHIIRAFSANLFDYAASVVVRKEIRLGQWTIVDGAAWIRLSNGYEININEYSNVLLKFT